ncbi:MAG: hypothetical protein K0U98_14330 [Deltaproteobacteria bacterium]|nr:hypothetical protein [Deltaproteobacteria bacterium]
MKKHWILSALTLTLLALLVPSITEAGGGKARLVEKWMFEPIAIDGEIIGTVVENKAAKCTPATVSGPNLDSHPNGCVPGFQVVTQVTPGFCTAVKTTEGQKIVSSCLSGFSKAYISVGHYDTVRFDDKGTPKCVHIDTPAVTKEVDDCKDK